MIEMKGWQVSVRDGGRLCYAGENGVGQLEIRLEGVSSTPNRRMEPLSFWARPSSSFMAVLFPAPLGPKKP